MDAKMTSRGYAPMSDDEAYEWGRTSCRKYWSIFKQSRPCSPNIKLAPFIRGWEDERQLIEHENN
jgi:hypothetical protein